MGRYEYILMRLDDNFITIHNSYKYNKFTKFACDKSRTNHNVIIWVDFLTIHTLLQFFRQFQSSWNILSLLWLLFLLLRLLWPKKYIYLKIISISKDFFILPIAWFCKEAQTSTKKFMCIKKTNPYIKKWLILIRK